jgi:hypothetical protein
VRRMGFGIGMVLTVIAAATAVAQLFSLLAHGGYHPVSLLSIWRNTHAGSLEGLQGLVEGTLSSTGWLPIQWLLQLPAWLVLGVVGGLLLLSGERRSRGFD